MSMTILVFFGTCVGLGSVMATPVLMQNLNSDQAINFKAGRPLTDEELSSDLSSLTRVAILGSSYRWPNAIIPYVISDAYTTAQRGIIAYGMSAYHNNTCIRFVPRTCETNYIRIFKSGSGCWSYIGLINQGAQDVSLDDGCVASQAPGIVMHEFMHAAGFFHEHSRPDRDTYVSVNLNNVLERKIQTQFQCADNVTGHHSRTFIRLWICDALSKGSLCY
ncbi:putative Metalloendopeptidase [Daphnia magna]|uniref:Metalloendopeptidase n=1 Tax=Daphnia magna TaxID=35525 RepID=A0A164Y1Y2_9CRUS|nr:putative Metalloendopeptidase [Daphnia magna]